MRQNDSSAIYEIAGHYIKVFYGNTDIELICQAYFHLARFEGAKDAQGPEIHFRPCRSSELKERHASLTADCAASTEKICRLDLPGGFSLFYFADQGKLINIFPDDIFSGDPSISPDTCSFVYENSYNGKTLPPNSSGIVHTCFWLLECLNVYRLHAASVLFNDVNILFAGTGGVGKTTSALNLAFRGGELMSDDQVLFQIGRSGRIEVAPMKKPIAVTENTVQFFPSLHELAGPDNRFLHKFHIPAQNLLSDHLVDKAIPEIVIFPEIESQLESGHSNGRVTHMQPIECFMKFLSGEILYPVVDPKNRGRQIDLVENLSRQAKAFRIINGSDMEANFERILSLLGTR